MSEDMKKEVETAVTAAKMEIEKLLSKEISGEAKKEVETAMASTKDTIKEWNFSRVKRATVQEMIVHEVAKQLKAEEEKVVEIVVEAMKPNRSLHDVTDAHKSGQLIMNVFIRGSVAMLQSNQRGSVVDTVTANITIPFIPTFITQKAVEFCLGHIEVIVEQAINHVFHRHLQVQIMMPLMVDDA